MQDAIELRTQPLQGLLPTYLILLLEATLLLFLPMPVLTIKFSYIFAFVLFMLDGKTTPGQSGWKYVRLRSLDLCHSTYISGRW